MQLKEQFHIEYKNRINWTVVNPSYCYTTLEFGGESVLFHLHLNETFFGIKCHSLSVQNAYDNIRVLQFFKTIVAVTGGLFEVEDGKGFKSFSEDYSENEGFISRRKFLGIPLESNK